MSSASGFVWSMNCDSWLPPKNSFIAATTGRMLMRAFGVALSISWIVIRSRTTRSIRRRPIRNAFWISSPLARMRRLPRWSMSSLGWRPRLQLDQVADDRGDVLAGDRAALARQLDAHPRGDAVQLLVELVAADPTEVVAAEVEEQALDQLAGVVTGRRVARAQLLVDLDQRLLLASWWGPCRACSR